MFEQLHRIVHPAELRMPINYSGCPQLLSAYTVAARATR